MAVNSTALSRPLFSPGRLLSILQDAALISIALIFVYAHTRHALNGGWTSIPFAFGQGVLIVLYFTRRRSQATSLRPLDWVMATIGGWLPLAFQIHETGNETLRLAGFCIQVVGASVSVICLTSLGRSFGVVAANRGLKTGGPYSFVRHPIYASYLVADAGFILANLYWLNALLIVVGLAAQIMRIRAEERVLTDSGPYTEYRAKVKWRLLPGVF